MDFSVSFCLTAPETRGRDGGKPAAAKLRKPVTQTKRAAFLRYCLHRYGRNVGECMDRFAMSRANVFAYLTMLNRDHGIGYEVKADRIRILLPPGSTASSVFYEGDGVPF